MKRFLIHIALFIVVIASVAYLADYCITTGLRKTEKGVYYSINKAMQDSINADVIMLGNSRCVCSYNTEIIDSVLSVNSQNLGVSGQPFSATNLRYNLYKIHNAKPKLIILNSDYLELALMSNAFEREQFYPYINDSIIRPNLDKFDFSWMDLNVPMYRYRGDYKLLFTATVELFGFKHFASSSYKGYHNDNTPFNGHWLDEELADGKKLECKYEPEVVAMLDKFLQSAVDDSINVIMVYAPLYKVVIDNQDYPDSVYAVYNHFSEKYSIPFVDYSHIEFFSDSTFFYNANHINKKGADIFSTRLAQKIDSLHLIN